ncbi:hypothetical protein C4564_00525 [Candidatus Microgenomates bacterium]|nr:MAG: hypothetical protein C4564_00525 [Candidatus Microgenomates bacterium]
MKKNFILVLIVFFALVLRFVNVANNPPATYGDEISFAVNAWSILKTGADEYGIPHPILFRAFDDYKAPIPVYVLLPFLQVFGLTTFAVRLPVVLFATATVGILFFLVRQLGRIMHVKNADNIGLVAALLLAISPWHMHLSRGYFESTIALFFFVGAIYLFLKSLHKTKYLLWSAVFFAATLYSYLTPRIVLVFFIPFLFFWQRKWTMQHKKQVAQFFTVFILLSIPLIYASVFSNGLARIEKLTQAREEQIRRQVNLDRNSSQGPEFVEKILHNRPVYWVRNVTQDYIEQFSPQFLFLFGDSSLRYGIGNFGMMYLIELPFLIIGSYILFKNYRSVFYFLLAWVLITPIPAAIVGRPFAVRSLAMLPAIIIIVAFGVASVWSYVLQSNKLKLGWQKVLLSIVIFGFVGSSFFYLVRYHFEYPSQAATWWGWENKQAIDLALKEQDAYDQIFISNFYSGLDLAFAFYTQQEPRALQNARKHPVVMVDNRHFMKFGKFYIGSLDIDGERMQQNIIPENSLYIARPEEYASDERIGAPDDGRVLFYIYRTRENSK